MKALSISISVIVLFLLAIATLSFYTAINPNRPSVDSNLLSSYATANTFLHVNGVVLVKNISPDKLPLHIPLPEIRTDVSDALDTHPEWEVNMVRKCFDDRGGALKIVKESMINQTGRKAIRYHLLCFIISEGLLADRIVERIDGIWQEITAFIPKDGTISAVEAWLATKVVVIVERLPR